MEKAVFNYSDFFNDDGGFDKIRNEFDKLGNDLVKKAKDIKENVKLFDLDQIDQIKEVEEKTEDLMKMFQKFESTKIDFAKVEKSVQEQQKKSNQTTADQIKILSKLDKELIEQKTNLKELNKLGTINGKVVEDVNKERVKAQVNIKKISAEIKGQQKEILKSNELSKKEAKLAEARIVLQNDEIKNRSELRERIKALRIVVDSLDFETQADEIKTYNDEINELTKSLSDTSDKFIQSKINIGNYEESIVNALKGTNLFQGELAVLNGVVDQAIGFFARSKEANEADTKAKQSNAVATSKLGKAIRGLSRVAKATFIIAFVGAIATLASALSQGRKGTILTQKALARFNVGLKVVINTLGDLGSALFSVFSTIGSSFSSVFLEIKKFGLESKLSILELTNVLGSNNKEIETTSEKIAVLNEKLLENDANTFSSGWDKISEAIGGFSKRYDDALKAINSSDVGIIRAFEIGDEIKRAELNLVSLRNEVAKLEITSDDSTRSLRDNLKDTDLLLEKRLELLSEEQNIALKNLELANAKARVDTESAGFNLSNDDVKFARELLDLNQQLAVTENPLDDNLLEGSQKALIEYLAVLGEVEVAELEIGKQRREIERDLFEQNLDLLIDLIDTEKNISEKFVNDTTKSFQNRVNEFNRFVVKFRENAQKELNEFTKVSKKLGKELDFEVQFNENGSFDVLINGSKASIENIVELNKELQSLGLAEIPINRFREFIVETRNAVNDFVDLNAELTLVGINVKELRSNLSVSQDEINALKSLEDRLVKLNQSLSGSGSASERKLIKDQIEKLEKDKQAITDFSDFQRLKSREKAIDLELKLVEKGSTRELELLQEKLNIEKQLLQKSNDEKLSDLKTNASKQAEIEKQLEEQLKKTINSVLTVATESQQKRLESAEKRVDRQNELVDIQSQRAQQGLENTLAFEQRELGKREAERLQEQKKKERIEKINALYSSYSNYASQGEGDNAIVKALRDFAILEAITASFGDGGVVNDKLPSNGIFKGQSHKGNKGGIPILVEGREGIFSANEMENLGKDNFYKMKEIASMGKVDSHFFSKQKSKFIQSVPSSVSVNSQLLAMEMREVKRAIESKPVQQWDASAVVNGSLDLVETIMTKNKTSRNHHKIIRKRL